MTHDDVRFQTEEVLLTDEVGPIMTYSVKSFPFPPKTIVLPQKTNDGEFSTQKFYMTDMESAEGLRIYSSSLKRIVL